MSWATFASEPSTYFFSCGEGNNCQFFNLYNPSTGWYDKQQCAYESRKFSKAPSFISNLTSFANRWGWSAGVGAFTNYLCGGTAAGGALFNILTLELHRYVMRLPLPITNELKLTHVIKDLTIRVLSTLVVANALNARGYRVTDIILIANIIFVELLAISYAAGYAFTAAKHFAFHYDPSERPEIERAKKFLEEHKNLLIKKEG